MVTDLQDYRDQWGKFDTAAFARDFEQECDQPLPEDKGLVERMVTELETKFPTLVFAKGGSRVKNGLWLWQNQRIVPPVSTDADHWQVYSKDGNEIFNVQMDWKGYRVDCDCADPIHVHGFGKMCAHYCAVRLYHDWFRKVNPVWRAILDLLDNSDQTFQIDVEHIYAQNSKTGYPTVRLYAFVGNGVSHQLAQRHRVRMTAAVLSEGLQNVEWGMSALPMKLAGYNYRWFFKREGGLQHVEDRIFYHKGVTKMMVERFQQRLADLASEALQPSVAVAEHGYVPRFADWELQQIGEIRARLEKGETAAQVVASLPEGVRSKLMIFGEMNENGYN